MIIKKTEKMTDESFNLISNRSLNLEINVPSIEFCPSCRSFITDEKFSSMTVKEVCAKHILEECINISVGELRRHKIIKWVLSYYSVNLESLSECSYTFEEKIINSERIPSNVKWNVVKIPIIYIKEMGQCPVCDRYFPDLHCCYYHLFCECELSTKEGSKNAINVMYWLQNFFIIHKDSLHSFTLLYGANRDCFLRKDNLNLKNSAMCKHCKLKLPDTISLKLHFEEEHCDRVDEGVVCFLCDFKALDDEKLGYHYSTCHLKCACQNFAVHLKACPAKNNQANMPVPCLFCHKKFTVESVFVSHIIECKPLPEEVDINIDRIYPGCEICGKRILIIRLDEHLKYHIRRNETYIAYSVKQTKISIEDLKTNEHYLDPEELRELLFHLEKNKKLKSV